MLQCGRWYAHRDVNEIASKYEVMLGLHHMKSVVNIQYAFFFTD